jgi:hypothetical protein
MPSYLSLNVGRDVSTLFVRRHVDAAQSVRSYGFVAAVDESLRNCATTLQILLKMGATLCSLYQSLRLLMNAGCFIC